MPCLRLDRMKGLHKIDEDFGIGLQHDSPGAAGVGDVTGHQRKERHGLVYYTNGIH